MSHSFWFSLYTLFAGEPIPQAPRTLSGKIVTVFLMFMGLTIFVVARGVERGLEQAVRFMVPALLLLMVVLLGYSINSGFFGQGVAFMFTPDFDKLTWTSVLAALGQAFGALCAQLVAGDRQRGLAGDAGLELDGAVVALGHQLAAERGDRVLVELSPYDLTRGRITYRYKQRPVATTG